VPVTDARDSAPASLLPFQAPAPTDISPLSLHDALPIFHQMPCAITPMNSTRNPCSSRTCVRRPLSSDTRIKATCGRTTITEKVRSEEHTSELQSRENLVCRLLLEKKKKRPADDTMRRNG